ncbi:hypothetical protein Tco_0274401, partial [Tanacetum coccineum]
GLHKSLASAHNISRATVDFFNNAAVGVVDGPWLGREDSAGVEGQACWAMEIVGCCWVDVSHPQTGPGRNTCPGA